MTFPRNTSEGNQKKNGLSLRSEKENENESSSDSVSLQEKVEKALKRSNGTCEALGNFSRKKILCFTFFFSPDHSHFFVTTFITVLIVAANFCVVFSVMTNFELLFVLLLLSAAFSFSFLVSCVDPGVYPRLKDGELDPLNIFQGKIVFCRFCHLHRPPLTSHCHTCNVCVLEHDHHCSILGGCVGKRNLRYFVLYLLSLSLALSCGLLFIGRRLHAALMVGIEMSGRKISITPLRRNSSSFPENSFSSSIMFDTASKAITDVENTTERNIDIIFIPALFVLLVDLIVFLLVGVFTVMYVYLIFTSLTRRESQRGQGSKKACKKLLSCSFLLQNLFDKCFPPPSRLVDSLRNSDKGLV